MINGQADLLLGYVMDQAIKLQDATNKAVYPIRFADYGVNMVSSGIIVQKDYLKPHPDVVKRFMRAATRSLEEAAKNPEAAVDAMLKAQPEVRRQGHRARRHEADRRALQGPGQPERPAVPRGREEHGRDDDAARRLRRARQGHRGQGEDYYTNDVPALTVAHARFADRSSRPTGAHSAGR